MPPTRTRPKASVDSFAGPSSRSAGKVKLKTVKLDIDYEPPAKKLRPLSLLTKPPVFDLPPSYTQPPPSQLRSQAVSQRKDIKGKGKAVNQAFECGEGDDDRLWVDMYEPTTETDLAVHKRKFEDVRGWLLEALEGGPSGKLKKYRRILALTGPAGTAKTATVRVLARELGFEILEWRNSMSDNFSRNDLEEIGDGYEERGTQVEGQTLFAKFQAFLERASTCHNIFTSQIVGSMASQSSKSSTASKSQPQSQQNKSPSRHIILLEDLPNILHLPTQARFRAALRALVDDPPRDAAPIVIIVSDAGVRGEAQDERAANGLGWAKEVVDVRTVLGPDLISSPYVTQISFNPISVTLMKKAIQSLLAIHFSSSSSAQSLPREALDIIVESSNGDIRSAIMALQFSYSSTRTMKQGKKTGGRDNINARVVLEAVTRREQSLVLFHLMGKILYNKRKGDPPNPNAAAKDLRKDKEIDAYLRDPPRLPSHLKEHERRASRVDVETLYADSPIDSSLLGLYIHQNYTQFCNDINECTEISEYLSWADWGGSDLPVFTNPYSFHLLTLGTLHSLPSPVTRRGQQVCKSEFFDARKKETAAADAVKDVQAWVSRRDACSIDTVFGSRNSDGGSSLSRWSQATIATELGGWLNAVDSQRSRNTTGWGGPAPSHRLFSHLPFNQGTSSAPILRDGDDELPRDDDEELWDTKGKSSNPEDLTTGGWLENDDIEEFD